jgi:peptide/nickel transport system substrate-binding protein
MAALVVSALLVAMAPNLARAAGSVIVGMQLEPPVLDPTANPAAAISQALYGNLYEGLVRFAPDGSVLPLLAQSWELSPDGMVYTFHLRQGVRFHDGRRFDAAAAKFSVQRGLAADSVNPQKSRLEAVQRVDVVDDYP